MPVSVPLTLHSIVFAIFLSPTNSNSTFVTSVLNWKSTPWASRYFCIGRINDSYWLYLVNFKALKSGSPEMWWMNLWKYNFISNAECQFSNANILLQYIQNVESNTSSSNTSSIVLSYKSSSGVMNNFAISIAPFVLKSNLPSVWASIPWLIVARHNE